MATANNSSDESDSEEWGNGNMLVNVMEDFDWGDEEEVPQQLPQDEIQVPPQLPKKYNDFDYYSPSAGNTPRPVRKCFDHGGPLLMSTRKEVPAPVTYALKPLTWKEIGIPHLGGDASPSYCKLR